MRQIMTYRDIFSRFEVDPEFAIKNIQNENNADISKTKMHQSLESKMKGVMGSVMEQGDQENDDKDRTWLFKMTILQAREEKKKEAEI